jgi:hypothetical protein
VHHDRLTLVVVDRLSYDEEMVALRLLTDRRDELSHLPVQTVNRCTGCWQS